jgi:hypothetical protein
MEDKHKERLVVVVDHLERLAEAGEANALAGFHRYAEGYANVRKAEEQDQGANLQRIYDELQDLRRALADDFYEEDVHRMLDVTDQLLRSVDPEVGEKLGKAAIGLARWVGRDDDEAGEKARGWLEELRER